jgi:hypothetical protein
MVIVQKVFHWFPVLLQVPIDTRNLVEYCNIILRECIMHIGEGMTVFIT